MSNFTGRSHVPPNLICFFTNNLFNETKHCINLFLLKINDNKAMLIIYNDTLNIKNMYGSAYTYNLNKGLKN